MSRAPSIHGAGDTPSTAATSLELAPTSTPALLSFSAALSDSTDPLAAAAANGKAPEADWEDKARSVVKEQLLHTDDEVDKASLQAQEEAWQADPRARIDGGLIAWMQVVASFMVHFAAFGIQYSYGAFQKWYQMVDFPHASPSSLSLVGTLGPATMFLTGIFVGRIAERVPFKLVVLAGSIFLGAGMILASFATQVWHLYLTQGVMYGLGCSLVYFPGVSVPTQWFDQRRSLAVGIAVAGSGAGGLVWSNVIIDLLPKIGSAWTLRITGLVSLAMLLLASAMIRTRLPPSKGVRPDGTRPPLLDLSFFKDTRFLPLFFGAVLIPFGYLQPFYWLPSYVVVVAKQQASFAANLLTIINAMSIVGRVATGWIADWAGNINTYLLSVVLTAVSVMAFWLPAGDSQAMLIVFAVMFGFWAGGFIALNATVAAQLFGVARLPSLLGLLYAATAAGNLAGSPIAGALITAAHRTDGVYATPAKDYMTAIVFSGVTMLVGSLGTVVLRFGVLDRTVWKRL
ncbi:hypothetical protein GGF32_000358 [Allomyces javanicus]|nr:hypothetical protein GGF32_000358 [Allomyces javanicus]